MLPDVRHSCIFPQSNEGVQQVAVVEKIPLEHALNEEKSQKKSPFIYQFSGADKRLEECFQADICDEEGDPTADYKGLSLSPDFEDPDVYHPIVENVKNSLMVGQSIPLEEEIFLEITLLEAFQHIIKAFNVEGSPFRIVEIYKIGSDVLPNAGVNYFKKLAQLHLKKKFSAEKIEEWFKDPQICETILRQANDLDFRIIISSDDILDASRVTAELLAYVSRKIADHPGTTQYFLNSKSALRNRKIVIDGLTRYAILALNTACLPIDLTCVGTRLNEEGKKLEFTLESPDLSSLNSVSIPLTPFLNGGVKPKKVALCSNHGIKVLYDILFDCMTVSIFNHYSWKLFLRLCKRLLCVKAERKLLDAVLAFRAKEQYDCLYRHKFPPNATDVKTLGGVIYLLLANDFSKIEGKKPEEPYQVGEFVFRACQSLYQHPLVLNCDLKKIWECVERYFWKPLGRFSKSDSALTGIKEAMLDDQIPFNVLYAWVKILAYQTSPEQATFHGGKRVIGLKSPLRLILPIDIARDSYTLNQYLSQHAFPKSFEKIYSAFMQSKKLRWTDFPLTPKMQQMGIDPSVVKGIIQAWIKEYYSPLNVIGLQLYLTFYHLAPDQDLLNDAFLKIPAIFIQLKSDQQKQALIEGLQQIVTQDQASFLEKINDCDFSNSTPPYWVKYLLDVKSDYTDKMAFAYFKKHKSHFRDSQYKNICWKFFNEELKFNFYPALDLFLWLLQNHPLNPHDEWMNAFIPLLSSYQKLNSILKYQYRPKLLKAFDALFAHSTTITFQNKALKIEFAKLFFGFLQELFSSGSLDEKESMLLAKGSECAFLIKTDRQTLWTLRIRKLIQNKKEVESVRLYLSLIEKKWIHSKGFIAENSSENIFTLALNLLQENEIDQALILLKSISNCKIGDEVLFQLIAIYLQKLEVFYHSQMNLELILKFIPAHLCLQVEPLLIDSLKKIFQEIQDSDVNNNSSRFLHHTLMQDSLFSYMAVNPGSWNGLLLDFLLFSLKNFDGFNEKFLWKTFEKSLNLFSHARVGVDKNLLLKLFDVLEKILPNASHPSESVMKWILISGEALIKRAIKEKKYGASQAILEFIVQQKIRIENFEDYLWQISSINFKEKTSAPKIRQLFLAADLALLKKHVSHSDIPQLLEVIKYFVIEENKLQEMLPWINFLFEFQEYLDDSIAEFSIIYSKRLIDASDYVNAVRVLMNTLQSSHERSPIESLLEQISKVYSQHTPYEEIRLLLDEIKKFSKVFDFTEKLIQRILNKAHLEVESFEEILSLMEYHPGNLISWELLWKKVNLLKKTPETDEIISRAWLLNRSVALDLKGDSAILLSYWFNLLSCLKKISHTDLLDFQNKIEWLFPFFENQETTLWAQKIFMILIEGVCAALNPKNPDFSLIEKWQDTSKQVAERALLVQSRQTVTAWLQNVDQVFLNLLDNSKEFPAMLFTCSILAKWNSIERAAFNQIIKKLEFFVGFCDSYHKNISKQSLTGLQKICFNFSKAIGEHEQTKGTDVNDLLRLVLKKPIIDNYFLAYQLCRSFINYQSPYEVVKIKKKFFALTGKMRHFDDVNCQRGALELIDLFENKVGILNKNKLASVVNQIQEEKFQKRTNQIHRWANSCFSNVLRFSIASSLNFVFKAVTFSYEKKIELLNSIFKFDLKWNLAHIRATYGSFEITVGNKFGHCLSSSIDLNAILTSFCPKGDLMNQLQSLYSENIPFLKNLKKYSEEFVEMPETFFDSIVLKPFVEEIVFRGLLQKLLLKDLIEHLLKKFAPHLTPIVHTSSYTIHRILIAALAFACIRYEGGMIEIASFEEFVERLISGILLGIVNEFLGIAGSFGVQATNRFSEFMPKRFIKCYGSLKHLF